jgi:hypothetical protein
MPIGVATREALAAISRVFRVAVMGGLMLIVGGVVRDGDVVRAQQQSVPQSGLPSRSTGIDQPGVAAPDDNAQPAGPMRAIMDEQRKKAINDDRRKHLEEDVARLQALTNELKTDVDKANKDELSLDVIRKAGEIEKLAHDVQSRMKN